MNEPVTIAVISDTHFGAPSPAAARRCDIADILLKRAVLRLNRLVRPDVTLFLGDIVDDGASIRAEDDLRVMKSVCDTLDAPYIAIPGNHDGDVEQFYRVFDRPDDIVDIAGVRFLPFMDQNEPRYCASRSAADIQRMREARVDFSGPIVSLQHVCLFRPGDDPVAPYNYTNADEIIRVMKESGVNLSVSGHHHHGAPDTHDGEVLFVNAPGLCESPFPFIEVKIASGEIKTRRHELLMHGKLHQSAGPSSAGFREIRMGCS